MPSSAAYGVAFGPEASASALIAGCRHMGFGVGSGLRDVGTTTPNS